MLKFKTFVYTTKISDIFVPTNIKGISDEN
ncbi:hypothetical protein M2326_000843 [Flavobacterium sp. 7A]|nr:hypothetical protein [Flavobacterium sp. 7A]